MAKRRCSPHATSCRKRPSFRHGRPCNFDLEGILNNDVAIGVPRRGFHGGTIVCGSVFQEPIFDHLGTHSLRPFQGNRVAGKIILEQKLSRRCRRNGEREALAQVTDDSKIT